jgi:uncharacterized protein YecT (DUF1311 family)
MKMITLLLICCCSLNLLLSQQRHPIDQIAYNELQEAVSNADMISAETDAHKKWDHLLDIIYQQLQREMSPATFAAIEESQAAWLKYRDAEIKAINRLYYGELQGTMWYAPAASDRKEVVRERALSLFSQLSILSLQKEEEEVSYTGSWVSTGSGEKGTRLDIREDFTLVWINERSSRYEVEFYLANSECGAKAGQESISIIEAGNPANKRCYTLQQDADKLSLTNPQGEIFTYKRAQ